MRLKNRKLVLMFLVVVAVSSLALLGTSQVSKPMPAVKATLAANPPTYSGPCPVVIHFDGKITVGQACTVKYRFIRSDGTVGPWTTHVFSGMGGTSVQTTWSLAATYSGWVAIEINSPVNVKSSQAAFSATCVPKPNITDARLVYHGEPNPEMDIMGANFGATQGTKKIKVDDAVVSNVLHWDNTSATIKFGVPPITKPPDPWEHTYKIAILDGSTVVSNVLSKRFLYTIDSLSPNKGLKGSDFTVNVWAVPTTPGGLALMMGSFDCSTTSWGGNMIKAKVPSAIPAGTYEVYLKKGGSVVSNKENFIVVQIAPIPIKKK
jgi:hypothetical protein